jgi:hypothetical protein
MYEEIAFIAYYFNWSREEVLSLPHWERKRWCDEISTINEKANQDGATATQPSVNPEVDDVPVLDVDEEDPFDFDE